MDKDKKKIVCIDVKDITSEEMDILLKEIKKDNAILDNKAENHIVKIEKEKNILRDLLYLSFIVMAFIFIIKFFMGIY